MPLTILPAVRGLSEAQLKRLAHCFKIERTDGQSFKFTSHDKLLPVGTDTYTPIGTLDASATRKESALKDHDVDYRGVISSPAITSSDLRAGRYRDAKVTELLLDWKYPFAGIWGSAVYWIGDVTFDGEVWQCQITGLSRWLKHRVGSVFTRSCEVTLGSTKCGFNLAGTIVGGLPATVTAVGILGMVDGEKRRIIRANPSNLSGAYIDNVFRHGKVTFTAGANAGLSGDIRLYTQATREIEMQLPFPFEITPTDAFTIIVGCDKRRTTCIGTFNNIVNHRGEPFLPGTDKVLRITPA